MLDKWPLFLYLCPFNLTPNTYVEAKDTREVIDIEQLNAEVAQTVGRINELRADIEEIIREIEG